MKKKLSLLFTILFTLSLCLFSMPQSALALASGSTYITTNKSGTPVWSSDSSKSTKIRTLVAGKYLTIVSTSTNSAGNDWGKTVNNTWIYMGNLKKSNVSAGSKGLYMAIKNDVPLRDVPESAGKILATMSKGDTIDIKTTCFNDAGNPWGEGKYKDKTYVVFMDNLAAHQHVYSDDSDICECGAVRLHETRYNLKFVTITGNVNVLEKPVAGAKVVSTFSKQGSEVYIVGRARNGSDMWLKVKKSGYVYAGDLAFSLNAYIREAIEKLYLQYNAPFVFYTNVKPGGNWDFKCGDLLGESQYAYNIYLGNDFKAFQFTGAQIGNVFYAITGRLAGFSEDTLLQASCDINDLTSGKKLSEAEKKELYKGHCEDPDDIRCIYIGFAISKNIVLK